MRGAEFARTISERAVTVADAKRRWEEAITAIAASPKYGGLKLAPQLGLLPIGVEPESGLWEFAHLQSGAAAQRGLDGKLLVMEEMGLVFVLIPGGTHWMRAQKIDPAGPNYDAQDGEAGQSRVVGYPGLAGPQGWLGASRTGG